MQLICPSCGGSRLESGSVQSTGKLSFRPEHAKFLTLKSADVGIAGHMCLDCGNIALIGDLAKCRELIGERAGSGTV